MLRKKRLISNVSVCVAISVAFVITMTFWISVSVQGISRPAHIGLDSEKLLQLERQLKQEERTEGAADAAH